MTTNAHAILGLAGSATEAQVRQAYRQLAMKHHPDRPGGDEERFKVVKRAFEEIEASGFRAARSTVSDGFGRARAPGIWEKPASPGDTWRDAPAPAWQESINELYEQMLRANRGRSGFSDETSFKPLNDTKKKYTNPQRGAELVARVGIREAFVGFNLAVPAAHGYLCSVNVPGGTPDGHRRVYTSTAGTQVTVCTRIDPGNFRLRGLNSTSIFDAGRNVGDVELDVECDALDLITGAWIVTHDFIGEELGVRIPAGFNPQHRLKIAGKGYYGWLQEYDRPSTARADMYLRLRPVFKKPSDIDPTKIDTLYNSIGPHERN